MTERMKDMVERHGECCKQTAAAKILGVTQATVRKMLDDGRLKWCCDGTMVEVRSIAEYIERPKQIDFETRLRKRQQRAGKVSRFHV